MSRFFGTALAQSFGLCACFLISGAALSQGIPEDRNINIVGINPPTANSPVPDTGLKQQNEPACAMKPSNPLHILCAFNDYRGVDNPAIGDAWEGYAYSINGGQTWFSDLLPGHPGHTQSLGLSFAADPQVAAAPGVALIAYIAADRGENADGGLFLQQMFEVNREAGAPWVPALAPIEVANGKAKKFIDKPFMYLHPGPPGGGTVTVSSVLEDGTSISQEAPAARLFIAHTEFSGKADKPKSEMFISRSDDYGQSWKTKELKIGKNNADSDSDSDSDADSDSSASGGGGGSGGGISRPNPLNQSASIAANGDNVCIVWRRFAGGKDDDAILAACSDDRGKKFDKAIVVSAPPDFIQFDQGTTEATFRVNSYPFITHDGEQFYAFWASRNPQPIFYSRIVYSTSVDGSSWTLPALLDDTLDGHQFMPVAAAANGTIQVAWYDTRNNLFQADFIQDLLDVGENPGDVDKIIRNTADIRTLQIKNGTPTISVQVSKYVEGVHPSSVTPQQLEFNFINDRLFKQGTVPFAGDYPHIAAATFRQEDGQWVSNIPYSASARDADFLVSWSDNRDVRGNVWEDLATPTTYAPPAANNGTGHNKDDEVPATEPESQSAPMLARTQENAGDFATAAAIADAASADAEPDLTPDAGYGACQPGTNQDRTRNQNVYSSIIRPGVSIDSPSASKPTGAVQRSHVIWVSNNETTNQTYTLSIENQPPDAGVNGRASFLQVPVAPFESTAGLLTDIAVVISANSTVARTVYVTSNTPDPQITVSVSDSGSTTTFGTITLNADVLSPDIQNPDVQNGGPQNPDIQNAEVHNPDIQNVTITRVENPDVQNPDVQNPDYQNPDYQNPDVQNPDVQNPDVQNSALDGGSTENPDVESEFGDTAGGYTDISFEVTNNGNTTSSYDLDAFVNANTATLDKTQLIATRRHFTETSRDCITDLQVQNQVIFNEINPDLSQFTADGSAYLAPGETILLTLRVWGDPVDLGFEPETVAVAVKAQSCNSIDTPAGTLDCDPPVETAGSTANGITFNFVPPLTVGNLPGSRDMNDDPKLPYGSDLDAINTELEQFGVRWQSVASDIYLSSDGFDAGVGTQLSGPFLAYVSASFPEPREHSINFLCPDGSGRSATVTSARVTLYDDDADSFETFANALSFNNQLIEDQTNSGNDLFTYTFDGSQIPIAKIEFVGDSDRYSIDDLFFEGVQCLPYALISGDSSILNSGTFIVANNMDPPANPTPPPPFNPVTVNGVTFGVDQAGFSAPNINGGGTVWLNSSGDFSTDDAFSDNLDDLLSANLFVPFDETEGTLEIPGLNQGSNYRLQLLLSNDLNTTANHIKVTVEGESWELEDWQTSAINVIAYFTASGPSVVVEFEALPPDATAESGRGILSGYVLHEIPVIPVIP